MNDQVENIQDLGLLNNQLFDIGIEFRGGFRPQQLADADADQVAAGFHQEERNQDTEPGFDIQPRHAVDRNGRQYCRGNHRVPERFGPADHQRHGTNPLPGPPGEEAVDELCRQGDEHQQLDRQVVVRHRGVLLNQLPDRADDGVQTQAKDKQRAEQGGDILQPAVAEGVFAVTASG